jgi:protein-S-isoprenylcysteine O-methyltransferase Ste14
MVLIDCPHYIAPNCVLQQWRQRNQQVDRNFFLLEQTSHFDHVVRARVRHPMYSAFWLWALAQALLLPNWIAGPAGLIGFGTLFFLRVGREEALIIETFGDEYRCYMERTSRILPAIY